MSGAATRAKRLVEEANGLIHKARERIDEYKDADRIPSDQQEKIDAWMNKAVELKSMADSAVADAEKDRKLADLSEWAEEKQEWLTKSSGKLPGMNGSGHQQTDEPSRDNRRRDDRDDDRMIEVKSRGGKLQWHRYGEAEDVAYHLAFRNYIQKGPRSISPDQFAMAEKKSLTAGIDIEGGFLVPDAFRAELIEAIEDMTFMRRVARVLPSLTAGGSIRVPTASDLDDATWTSELASGALETAQPFGARALTPHPLAKRVKVSNTLLRLSAIDVESWIQSELAARFAEAEENAFLTGTGNMQPEGVFTSALVTGVTAAAAAAITGDDLIRTEYDLKPQYRQGASWIIHRTVLLAIARLKTGDGQYIWRPGLSAGMPSTLLNHPIYESEYAPSSIAAQQDVAALGDWGRSYWIVDSLAMQVQRLVELYAATNEVGFIGRKETDGMIVDPNGVTKLTMSA